MLSNKLVFYKSNKYNKKPRHLEHAQLNEAACKNTQCTNQTHSHENTQQNMIQHHGHKLPLFSSLKEKRDNMSPTRKRNSMKNYI